MTSQSPDAESCAAPDAAPDAASDVAPVATPDGTPDVASVGTPDATPVVAYLGLGSNLGDRLAHLRRAVLLLDSEAPKLSVTAVSPVYETEPIGGPEQGAYLNIVIQISTSYSPQDLLGRCLEVERQAKRIRKERWGPRTLDIDILWMDGISVNQDKLTIPHPRMRQRRFVMIPLGDLAPDFLADWDDPQDGAITRRAELFDEAWPSGDADGCAQ